jgi:RND family efflux transporter MFP subunit
VRTAEANVVRARLAYGQARTNLQQIQARQSDIRAARAAVAQNQAALNLERRRLADASIRSPIDGVIADRLTEPGQLAGPTQAVMRIVALNTVFFEAQVPETDLRAVRPGQPVNVRVDAYPGQTFAGRIAKVYPTGNNQSRNFAVRILLPNQGGRLRPGLFARGEVVAEQRPGVVVSKDALVLREGKSHIFVASDDGTTAELRTITTGVETPETIEVRAGVKAGDRIIVAGQDALQDGGKIRIQSGDNDETGTTAAQAASAG